MKEISTSKWIVSQYLMRFPMLYNDYVTGITMLTYAMVYEEEFKINHPFVYTIVKTSSTNEETGIREVIPLFAGHVVNPEYWFFSGKY